MADLSQPSHATSEVDSDLDSAQEHEEQKERNDERWDRYLPNIPIKEQGSVCSESSADGVANVPNNAAFLASGPRAGKKDVNETSKEDEDEEEKFSAAERVGAG